MSKNLVIVTGLPRTATTAVGKIISFSDEFSSIHEPFNIDSGIKELNHRFVVPGRSITLDTFNSHMLNIAKLNLNLKRGLFEDDKFIKKIVKLFLGGRTFNSYLLSKLFNKKNIVVKDPFLVFATSELSKKYKVVITNRPLKNIAASYKRMNWSYMLNDFERLSENLDFDYKKVESIINEHDDISDEVIASVKIFSLFDYYYKQMKPNPNIFFISQDNLSKNPIATTKTMFDFLNIDFSERIKNNIYKLQKNNSNKKNPNKNTAHDMSYNKKYSNLYYNEYLNKEEMKLIRRIELDD